MAVPTLTIGGVDVTTKVDLGSIEVTSSGTAEPESLTVTLVDVGNTLTVTEHAAVVLAESGGAVSFGGFVVGVKRDLHAADGRRLEVTAAGKSMLLDRIMLPSVTRPAAESDKTRIEALLTTYGSLLSADFTHIATINAVLPEQVLDGRSLRSAIQAVAELADPDARFYVDADGKLHYFKTLPTAAPYEIVVGTPGVGERAPLGLEVETDARAIINAYYVQGATDDGSGWVTDATSIAAYGRREAYLNAPDSDTTTKRDAYGAAALARTKDAIIRGTFAMVDPDSGWAVGQTLTITSAGHGLSADTFPVQRVRRRYLTPAGVRSYVIEFGGPAPALSSSGASPQPLPGRVIGAGTLSLTPFADTIRPVAIVDALPTLAAAEYPPGATVVLTTDGKLYRNVADVWTAAVDAVDLTGEITETQIAPESITTPKLATGAVTADNILAGSIKADHLDTNAVTAGKVAAGAISATELAAEVILAETKIATGNAPDARVEIDDLGVRNYGASGELLVNIPTTGDPVSVKGEIEASSLVSTTASELRGTTTFPGSAVATLEVGVADPTAAPVIAASTPTGVTFTSTPTYPGHGLCYDAAGDTGGATATYWVGADSTSGTLLDLAYEYNASTGALLRTIRKTGTTQTLTATAGYTGHQQDLAYGYTGTTNDQFAVSIVMPSDRGTMTIKKVSVYLAGREGTCSVRNMVWNTATPGAVLGQSATYTAVDKGATNAGDSVQYNRDISTPFTVAAGTTIRAGAARMISTDGWQIDTDTAAGATGYIGDGANGSFSPWGTWSDKPNVYVTYDYEVDSSEEGTTGKTVGVARQGSYIWVLDANGVLFRYLQSDLSYVDKFDLSAYVAGTKANAGLFWDGTNLIITTATGTTGTDQVRFIKVTTAGAYSSTLSATGLSINGSTTTVRGGYYASGDGYYWVALTGSVTGVYAFNASTGAAISNVNFGVSGEIGSGVTYASSYFRTWSSTNPTKVWRYTDWTWTTESAVYWVCYTWYDITGTTHETAVSPRASVTMTRRRQLGVTTPAIPGGSGEPPDRVRVYMTRNATDPGSGASYQLQVTDALTARTLETYASGGAANPTANDFPAATAAELKSATAGWSLKGDGTFTRGDGLPLLPVGRMPYATPLGVDVMKTDTGSSSLAAVSAGLGGALAVPMLLAAPMILSAVTMRQAANSGTKTAEWRLYVDNGDASIDYVTGATGTFSYTASVASWETSSVASPVDLAPGLYWLVIRNTSTSQGLQVSYAEGTSASAIIAQVALTAAIAALGSTIDLTVAADWAPTSVAWKILLRGRVFGESATFPTI